jgi:hypothetical protein
MGMVILRGNTRPEANAKNDRGRVADELTLHHLMLQLQRTPEQEQALQQFIRDIHDPNSPLFHNWITAAEFGQRYGVPSADVAKVTDWLESQGFTVNLVYPNQMLIDFTGTAGQIRQAFHTEIHNLLVKGQAHIANMSDPQIPAALASTVAGVVSLNDFRPHSMLKPHANFTVAVGAVYAIVPADLWTIYNFNPAFGAGFSGQGQTIVVLEDSDLYSTADWDTFRSTLGLATAYPAGSLTQVNPPSTPTNNCTDPGVNVDDAEAAADAEWASAGAPSATIVVASCADTETSFGGFIALQNLLNAGGTPPALVSMSYGMSESLLGAAYNAYINSMYQQAVTAGVSVFVASGDAGAAESDEGESYAANGINVSGFTSTPYNVSVGGTDFADFFEGASFNYWNSTNAASYGSAISYLPEIPWNDSCASVVLAESVKDLPTYGADGYCNNYYSDSLYTTAGGGGPSGCATGAPDAAGVVGGTCAGYAKPAWQSGFIGNPSDGVRDIPDVSLFAGDGAWGHYYVVCFSDLNNFGSSCNSTPDTWAGGGGTSIAAPIMAAIQSLVNQATGSRWGNPNPTYYSLAATEYGTSGSTSCNSALGNAVASNCTFYDVNQIQLLTGWAGGGPTGGDIDVPCIGLNCYLPSGTYGVLSTAPQTLSSVMVTSLGSGYTGVPSCALSGGGGSGATCSAFTTGVVNSVTLTNGGEFYAEGLPSCTLTGGGGTGATCALSLCSGATSIVLCDLVLTTFGSGYTYAPTCTISTTGDGSGATCTATVGPGIATSLTSAGSGYTTMPYCVLNGGGGTGGTCAALAANTSDAYQPAFTAAAGWDFATGIGTVNATNLVSSMVSSYASLSSLNLAFPTQSIYTSSATQKVTVTNTGTHGLTLFPVKISGPDPGDFPKTSDTCSGATVIPNGTCAVNVTFTPLAAGGRSASLVFTEIAPNSPQTVTLSGIGTGVGAGLSSTSLTFPDQIPGTTSPAQTVTLTNTGNALLTLTSINITGTNKGDFTETQTCGSTLAAGANCTITVTFTPAALGSRTAAITITDNALDTPQTVSLAGTGDIPVPVINQPLVPASAAPGGPGFTLTVNGTGFAAGATVKWNGAALATASVSSEELTATVPAANIASAGTAWVTVVNPGLDLVSNMGLFSVATPAPTVTFSNASGSPLTVGTNPQAIAVGDFNGDGKLDLAVANLNYIGDHVTNGNVTVLLGNGDGTFTPTAASPATGPDPNSIAVGDFNRDGKLDLAVVNQGSNNVTILLGNGDGTFTPTAASPATGPDPNSIAVGDFNGDGKLDLAVVNQGSNNVTILLGNGDGSFTPAPSSPAIAYYPWSIVVGDFNGDGRLDLAVANSANNNVTILLGNGDGSFTPTPSSPATGPEPRSVAVGDFNGDGKLDLAVVNVGSNNVTILLGNGDGTFTPTASSPATGNLPVAIAAGDLNGDGHLDLAVANDQSTFLTILLGNGDGTFTPASSPTAETPQLAVAVGDFNGDGRLDLATVNLSLNNVSVLLQLPPPAGVLPDSLTFGNQVQGTTSRAQMVTLTNPTTAALSITGIVTSANFGETDNCDGSVAAGSYCTINVTFSPTTTGTLTGTLTITVNSNGVVGSPLTVNLSGTGTQPSIAISGVSPGAVTLVPGGSSQSVTVNLTDTDYTGSVTLATSTLPSGVTATIIQPGTGSSGSITLQAASNAALVSNQTITITAGGSGVSSVTSTFSLTVLAAAEAVVTLSPTSLTFQAQMPGTSSGAEIVTLTNTGNATLTITNITTSANFSETNNCGGNVLPNGSCTISVTFSPTVTGPVSGTLTITDNANGVAGSTQTVSLAGTGGPPDPVVGISPSSLTFGNQIVGTTSGWQPVTLSNTGDAPLTITSMALSANFRVNTTCGVVASGAACVINVDFSPTAAGPLTGTLTITDDNNGVAGSTQTVNLSGTATNPDFTLGASSGSSTSATVAPGSSATYTLSVGSVGVVAATVSFTCTGAPSEASCSVSPILVTAGNNVTVTVTTTAASLSAPFSRPISPIPPLSPGLRGLLMLALALAAIAWAIRRRNQPGLGWWQAAWFPLAAGLLLALVLAACGGGGGGGGGGGTTSNPGTPAGTYTLTVTGSSGSGSSALSHSVTLKLTVS